MKIKLEDFIEGDKKAFDWVYATYAPSMFGVCMRYTNCRDDAQEILQESFIKVYENRKKFDHQKDLAPWIKTIVIHRAVNFLKSQKKLQLHDTDHFFEQVIEIREEENSKEQVQKQLLNILQNMPDGYRTIFNLYVLDNLTHQEIADYLSISVGTSKSQLAKAKSYIQNKLKNKGA